LKAPIFILCLLAGVAAADLPKKAPISRYTPLWTNSPFTSKPPPPAAGPENNPLDDYSLIGISPINDNGYRVTLINKKKPEERITVDSGSTKTGFKILSVTRKAGDPLGTVVNMMSGSMKGSVSFDQKLLTLAAAPAAKAVPPVPGQPPQPPAQAGQVPQPMRQPRPRVVPPPAPAAAGQAPAASQPAPQNQRPQRRPN
jgi:hypothetical protein